MNELSQIETLPQGWKSGLLIALVVVGAIVFLTAPPSYIDSFHYAKHIVEHGSVPADRDPFYDFGHVLWRPAGRLTWHILRAPLQAFSPYPVYQAAAGLVVINLICAFLCAALFYFLILRATGVIWIAIVTVAGFMAARTMLDHVLTGTAYPTGAMFQIASFYICFRALQQARLTPAKALLSGILAGASVVIWFPYSFTLVGFFFFPLFWTLEPRSDFPARLRWTGIWSGAIAVVLLLTYIPMATLHGIHSVAGFREWVDASRYGIKPTRGLIRTAFAIPRSFLWMGDAGVMFKRFIFDPASRRELAPKLVTGAFEIAAVYGALAMLIFTLLQKRVGRLILLCLLAIAVPTLVFAIFLFDPSATERYFAFFPLSFLGLALLMTNDLNQRWVRMIAAGFCLFIVVVNLVGMSRFGDTPSPALVARLEAINSHAGPHDCIMILTLQDDANAFVEHKPFDPLSRNQELLYATIPVGSDYISRWKAKFAERVLLTWDSGGRVWVSTRMLAEKPLADWHWVEGDENRITWAEIPPYFKQLEFGDPFGGPDAFVELPRSPHNEQVMRESRSALPAK